MALDGWRVQATFDDPLPSGPNFFDDHDVFAPAASTQ
jgi:hypothetical protein